MSQKPSAFRAHTEGSPAESPVNITESYNGCFSSSTDSASELDSDSRLRSVQDGLSAVIIARFWAKVRKDGPLPVHRPELGPCWLWTGSLVRGYGQFVLPRDIDGGQKHLTAHRVAYRLALGHPIPDQLQANHHCDRPRCCRPSHLFLGTQQDNLADARRKGRLNNALARTRVLTPTDRLTIYETPSYPGVGNALARQYGVTRVCISLIRKGRFTRPVVRERVADVA